MPSFQTWVRVGLASLSGLILPLSLFTDCHRRQSYTREEEHMNAYIRECLNRERN